MALRLESFTGAERSERMKQNVGIFGGWLICHFVITNTGYLHEVVMEFCILYFSKQALFYLEKQRGCYTCIEKPLFVDKGCFETLSDFYMNMRQTEYTS